MDVHNNDTAVRIARRIVKYLMNHPASKDTLEGITEWWLAIEYIEETVDEVSQGLSLLCLEGLVVEEKGAGSLPYYRLNGNPENYEITE